MSEFALHRRRGAFHFNCCLSVLLALVRTPRHLAQRAADSVAWMASFLVLAAGNMAHNTEGNIEGRRAWRP